MTYLIIEYYVYHYFGRTFIPRGLLELDWSCEFCGYRGQPTTFGLDGISSNQTQSKQNNMDIEATWRVVQECLGHGHYLQGVFTGISKVRHGITVTHWENLQKHEFLAKETDSATRNLVLTNKMDLQYAEDIAWFTPKT